MLLSYFIDELLGTQGVKYLSTEESGEKLTLTLEMPRKEHVCPHCGKVTDKVHDYRYQEINAGYMNHRHVTIKYRKRRYACPDCRKRFIENNDFVGRYQRMTKPVIANIINSLREVVTFKHVAKENKVSSQTVMRVFDQLSFPSPTHLPEALGIDEFKGNTNKVKYQVILTDLDTGKPIDILPDRYEANITRHLLKYDREERDKVKVFVSDMFREYDRIADSALHNATKVVDRFHWVRQMIWAFENIRKREQKRLGRARQKYFKKSKGLLIKRLDELSDEKKQAVQLMLSLSSDLQTAHFYKEQILGIMDIEDIAQRKKAFSKITDSMKNSGVPELEKCADSYYNWFQGILNSLGCDYSNGLTEGDNNKIKVIKRIGFGYKNHKRFRARILHCFS